MQVSGPSRRPPARRHARHRLPGVRDHQRQRRLLQQQRDNDSERLISMAIEVRKYFLPLDLRFSYDNEPFYKAARMRRASFSCPAARTAASITGPRPSSASTAAAPMWNGSRGLRARHALFLRRDALRLPQGIKGCLPLGLCAVTLDEGPRVFGRLLGYEDIERSLRRARPPRLD